MAGKEPYVYSFSHQWVVSVDGQLRPIVREDGSKPADRDEAVELAVKFLETISAARGQDAAERSR
jgi:hypothetical protein